MPTPLPPVPVLSHGFLGFVRQGPIVYFRNVERALRADGIAPLIPPVPPAASIAGRAEALARILDARGDASFVLFGHSMGGLDARYLAAHLDPDRRVKAVITVGTPHRGSPVAQRFLDETGWRYKWAGRHWLPALRDLDPAIREREPIPDRPDVRYESYAARRPANGIPWWLRAVTGPVEGENDGMVSVASARWGRAHDVLTADHFELVGWSLGLPGRAAARPFDHIPFWRRIVGEAVAEG